MIEVKQTQKKGDYYVVSLSNSHTNRLLENIVFQYSIFPGKCFSGRIWQRILDESTEEECYKKILRLLSIKAWAEREIQNRLRRHGFSNTAIASAVTKAKHLHLIDDAKFVKAYLDQERSIGRFGLKRIIANLRKRGISSELINEIVREESAQADPDTDFCNALKLGEKKWQHLTKERDKSRSPTKLESHTSRNAPNRNTKANVKYSIPHNKKIKLLRYLAGRGFSSEICYRVAEYLTKDNDE